MAFGSIYSDDSRAQFATSGYICDSKNPGGEDTRLYYREQNGVAENLSPTATFPIVCPVVVFAGFDAYFVTVSLGNGGDIKQTFSCALEEYDLYHKLVRTIGRSIKVGAYDVDDIFWDSVVLSDFSNYLSVRCILPPRGNLGQMFVVPVDGS